jgi:Protein of unknown function (DUF4232)
VSRQFGVVAALVAAGLLAAGCSNSGSPSATSTTTKAPTTSSTVAKSTTTTTSTAASTTSTSGGPGTCSQVTAASTGSQGAAGTIVGTMTITNAGSASCTMMGYPSMALLYPGGTTLPVTMADGLTVSVSGPATAAPTLVTLAPGAAATFTYQYSDVPTGSETSCPSSTNVSAIPPGTSNGSQPIPLVLSPCDNGTIHVSPVYASS